MFEELGPNMARAIVGDAYNPDYKYELETSEHGMRVHITNRETGESKTLELEPEEAKPERLEPIWDINDVTKRAPYQRTSVVKLIVIFMAILAILLGIVGKVMS